MDVEELIERAWKAVQKAGVSEAVQPTAFKEAVEYLRAGEAGRASGAQGSAGSKTTSRKGNGDTRRKTSKDAGQSTEPIDESTFFETLASESGLKESDLRDVLQLGSEGAVLIGPPTRELGKSVAQQAQTVIALVAGARTMGLGENPVRADAVRAELERKRCYNGKNYSAKHLGPLKGFNAGATGAEIRPTSKAPEEFKAAVNRIQGKSEDGADD